ncbi:MAG: hypothetical protein RLY20_657 [Verrucomicrobiota bacterium]|jgi:hypothetical protein
MLSEQELIAYLENTLSSDERKRVEAELERDPQARRELLRQFQLDAALRATLNADTANERVKQSILTVVRGEQEAALKQRVLADTTARPSFIIDSLSSIFRRPALGLSFAAALVLFVVWFVQRPATTNAPVELPARVELAGNFSQPQLGDTIRAGDIASATVKFADGTTLHLEPGTEISLVAVDSKRSGGKQLKLISGALSADVAKQPPGLPLLIQTPHALVTVVGTEFDLSVATNQTALEVTHGLVKMTGSGKPDAVNVAAGEFAVAAEKTPLRYGRLARHPFLWPFSSASIWNHPLGSEAKFSPVPGKTFLADGPLTNALRQRRPILGSPADPLRRIWVNGEARTDARLAEVNLPGANISDSWVLLQPGRRYALELRGVTVRANGDLEAQAIARTDLAGPGADETASEAKPLGLSNLGGLLRAGELENGICHALSCRIPRPQLGGRNNFQTPSTVWPATGGDAASAEFLNVGTLLALPPDVNIAAKFGTNGPAYELARAMQDYGVYVTGVASASFVLLTDGANHSRADEWLNQLVPLLQVVTNNSPVMAGKLRRQTAPELPGEAK